MTTIEKINTLNFTEKELTNLDSDSVSDVLEASHWLEQIEDVRVRAKREWEFQIMERAERLAKKFESKFYAL